MPRISIPRGKLLTIIEQWLNDNAEGGEIRMWDIADNGAFQGVIADVGSARALDDVADGEE